MAPESSDLQQLVEQIAGRIGRALERRGVVERDLEDVWLATDTEAGPLDDPPHLVSPTLASFSGGPATSSWRVSPWIRPGTVAVCYSDRRNDPNNFTIDHFCSFSRDQGRMFQDVREKTTLVTIDWNGWMGGAI